MEKEQNGKRKTFFILKRKKSALGSIRTKKIENDAGKDDEALYASLMERYVPVLVVSYALKHWKKERKYQK